MRKKASSQRRANDRPFIGDQILAAYQLLGSCCCVGFCSAIGGAALFSVAKPSVVADIQKQFPSDAWKYISDPKYTLPVGIGLILIAIFEVWWGVSTWRGRRWALWLHLIFHGSGGVLGLIFSKYAVGELLSLGIVLYCILRLTGSVGPKRRKR